ncbi:unnamed protein product [Penicillium roqueforti FM164]|uniref:Uncharacterized protein n=1 Tax=Penicillium roqueforti (strain FM164) TaxID=1365484 RepID=W6QRT5_PENRF|nr:unnamed protein product [Penicillium roqueforti FM164]
MTHSIPWEVQVRSAIAPEECLRYRQTAYVRSSMDGETPRIANIGQIENVLRTIHDLAPCRLMSSILPKP